MQTLEQPRSSRNTLFWSLHTAGWGAYGLSQSFGALLNQRHGGYMEVIWIAALVGFLLSLPLRYIYRRLWGRHAFVVAAGVLATCYVTGLAVRAGINLSYKELVEPGWEFKTLFELFEGSVSTTYLMLCWSALYFAIRYYDSERNTRDDTLNTRYGVATNSKQPGMLTLEQFRSNRNLLFWSLHAAGWGAYGITQYFSALLYEKPSSYAQVIWVAAISGFILSIPMRYIYRRLWGRPPRTIALSVLITCYITGLAIRVVINLAYKELIEPDWEFKTLFELFEGSMSTTYLLLCWSALYFGIRYYESEQQQREAVLKAVALAQESQLKMLRYQLNPHFLFNTLNAISTLILDNQNRTANQAISRLSEFLRYTLDQDPMKKVTLRQEIEALDLYLGTERLRFGERLRLEYAIEGPALEALIPSLLLQPLLENALKYAISPREQGGCIRIEGRARGVMLEVSVVDDGPGIRDPLLPNERRGVGLRNTRERLAVLYGQSHRFAVLNSHPGLRIDMALPMEVASPTTEPAEQPYLESKRARA
jgi:two-component system LytT family sensor kinase